MGFRGVSYKIKGGWAVSSLIKGRVDGLFLEFKIIGSLKDFNEMT